MEGGSSPASQEGLGQLRGAAQLTTSQLSSACTTVRRIGLPAVSEEADGCGGSAECAVVGTTVVSVGTSTNTQ